MSDTLTDPTVVQVISDIGVVLRSVVLLVDVMLIFRVKDNVSRAVLSDATSYPMAEMFLTTAMLRTTAITFDIAMLASLLGILSTVGLVQVILRGRR